jgi:hypothetical protein
VLSMAHCLYRVVTHTFSTSSLLNRTSYSTNWDNSGRCCDFLGENWVFCSFLLFLLYGHTLLKGMHASLAILLGLSYSCWPLAADGTNLPSIKGSLCWGKLPLLSSFFIPCFLSFLNLEGPFSIPGAAPYNTGNIVERRLTDFCLRFRSSVFQLQLCPRLQKTASLTYD